MGSIFVSKHKFWGVCQNADMQPSYQCPYLKKRASYDQVTLYSINLGISLILVLFVSKCKTMELVQRFKSRNHFKSYMIDIPPFKIITHAEGLFRAITL